MFACVPVIATKIGNSCATSRGASSSNCFFSIYGGGGGRAGAGYERGRDMMIVNNTSSSRY